MLIFPFMMPRRASYKVAMYCWLRIGSPNLWHIHPKTVGLGLRSLGLASWEGCLLHACLM